MRQKMKKYITLLFIFLTISILIWKGFDMRNTKNVRAFQYLTSLSPAEIISYQEQYNTRWKYFIAAKSLKDLPISNAGTGNNHDPIGEYFSKIILQQLKQHSQNSLDLSGVEKRYADMFTYYLDILNKYNYYDKDSYCFPVAIPCYYEDTFGADREGGKRVHQGTDLFNKKGAKIISVCNGVVEKLGWNRLGGDRVGIRGEDQNYYYYAHLDQINEELYVGKVVSKGDYLGTMGNTGDAITTPDHLHFGIELSNKDWINPYPFLKVWDHYTFAK